jgi:hypothetical protein
MDMAWIVIGAGLMVVSYAAGHYYGRLRGRRDATAEVLPLAEEAVGLAGYWKGVAEQTANAAKALVNSSLREP